jgi:phenylalanyl-tRNA synthetase alpha chain
MVHPVVLESAGVDAATYTGFAFGMGLERTLMSQFDLAEIRDLVEGDVRVTLALGREG